MGGLVFGGWWRAGCCGFGWMWVLGPARALSVWLLVGVGRVWASVWFHIVLLAPAYGIHPVARSSLLRLLAPGHYMQQVACSTRAMISKPK